MRKTHNSFFLRMRPTGAVRKRACLDQFHDALINGEFVGGYRSTTTPMVCLRRLMGELHACALPPSAALDTVGRQLPAEVPTTLQDEIANRVTAEAGAPTSARRGVRATEERLVSCDKVYARSVWRCAHRRQL